MVRLTTLGNTDLRLDGGASAEAVLRQPRRFALLVYLALEGRTGYVRRDRVLGTFWPESADADGRRALSQALHFLRQHLGAAAVETRGQEELRLAAVSTDACQLLAAADAADPEAVVRLAAGEFLPGFFSGGLREFDDWVDRVRANLRRTVAEAAWAAAEQAAHRSEWVAAGAYARRAAAACQGDEAALRRLMEFQASLGDRAGALEAYEAFSSQLARDYEAAPAEATRALAQEIRERTPDPAAPAFPDPSEDASRAPAPTGGDAPAAAGITEPNPTQPSQRSDAPSARRSRAGLHGSVAVAAVLLLAFASLWGLRRTTRRSMVPDRARVLVEAPAGPLGSALTSVIIGRLGESKRIEVLAPGSPPRPADDIPEFVLRTTILSQDTVLNATALLLDPERGQAVGTASFIEPARPGAPAVDRLAGRIVLFARESLGAELERRRAELSALPPAVLGAWLETRRKIVAADSLRRRGLHDVALIRLASADSEVARLEPQARRAALLPRTRAELAYRRMFSLRSQPTPDTRGARAVMAEGVAHATRALALAPADGRATELRGALRHWLWLTTPPDSDRFAEPLLKLARADLKRATRLTPAAAQAWTLLSNISQLQGDFAFAYLAAQNALAADVFLEQGNSVRVRLFSTALEVNDVRAAERSCELISQDDAGSWMAGYCALLLLAWPGPARPVQLERATGLRERALRDPTVWQGRDPLDAAYAVVLVKAGRTTQARQLAAALVARMKPADDALPEVAWVYRVLGDTVTERKLLERFVAARPARRSWVQKSRRFTDDPAASSAL